MFRTKKSTKEELDVKIAYLSILMTQQTFDDEDGCGAQTRNYISQNTDVDIIKWEGQRGGQSGNNRDSTDLPTAKAADSAEPSDLTLSRTLHDKDSCVKNVNMLEGEYKNLFYLSFLVL